MKFKIILALLILSLSNTFAQDNPYEVFGHTSKVVYETKVSEYLTIKNSNFSSQTKAIAFNFEDRVILFLGDKDTILKTLKIEPEQLLRFLSVDPLTKDYPWYTPYQFAGNKPIMAIDLDGLEEFVKIYLPDGGTGYNYIKTINYSDLYPGQKYGPLGKAGTVSVLFKTYADNKKSFSEAKVQISYLDNNNQRIFKEGIFDFGKTLGAYSKFANSIQGGANGDPGTDQTTTKEGWTVTAGIVGTMSGVGLLIEGGLSISAAVATSIGIANNIDEIGTNSKGESLSQQLTTDYETKNFIGNIMSGVSILNLRQGLKDSQLFNSPFKIGSTVTDAYSVGNLISPDNKKTDEPN